MKPIKINLLLAVIFSIISTGSCELFTDEETDKVCAENSLTIKLDMPVQYILQISTTDTYPTAEHKVSNATELQFNGYIRKIDCNGGENGYYKLNFSIYPKEKFKNGGIFFNFNVGSQNSFSFSNKRDYMSITYKMKMIFDDGRKYESNEIVENSERFQNLLTTSNVISVFLNLAAKWTITN